MHSGSSDEQLGADELRAGDVVRRQVDLADELSPGRDLEHARLAVHGVPQVAVRVDAAAVRLARPLVAVEDALAGQAAVLGRVVPREHGPLRRVREVHGPLVWRPPDRVGDRDGASHGPRDGVAAE